MRFVRKPTAELKHGINIHRSNRAKKGEGSANISHVLCCYDDISLIEFSLFKMLGLYHGKDIRSGNNISFSKKHTKRKWYPNVINKRVWSESLNDWVRFKMTTTALRGIDTEGGIDNYLMNLDDRSVAVSLLLTSLQTLWNYYHIHARSPIALIYAGFKLYYQDEKNRRQCFVYPGKVERQTHTAAWVSGEPSHLHAPSRGVHQGARHCGPSRGGPGARGHGDPGGWGTALQEVEKWLEDAAVLLEF
jgi:large subunit ribosomal protein L28